MKLLDRSTHEDMSRPSILMVDDDPFSLSVQSLMLQEMGYTKLSGSRRAEEALGMATDPVRRIDIVICDLNMPGIDGIEFLQALGTTAFQGSAILLSSSDLRILHTVQKLLAGQRLEILGALKKPASRMAMQAVLERWRPRLASSPELPRKQYSSVEVEVASRENQWVLHYQPKVSLRTGALVGLEALVRWNHPRDGLVYPDGFVGVAEDCGAIDALTDWVLLDSMRQSMRWREQGLRAGLAVNISMENLRARGFAQRVAAFAEQTGMAPQDMTLEITESRVMSLTTAPLENLVRLRLQRFGLSIDDFGTGHSSLAQLRDIPFTELKVDRGFVHGARVNPIIRPILDGSIGIARQMGLLCVAEGVENEEDWRLLQEIDCDLAQGYFIGRPMPAAGVPAWLDGWYERWAWLKGATLAPIARAGGSA